MVKGIAIDGGTVQVQIALTVAGCPLRDEITSGSPTRCRPSTASRSVDVGFTVMTDEERAAVRAAPARRPGGDRRLASRPTATPRAGPSRSPTRRRAPGCCSSRRARAASASRRSPTNLAVALAQRGRSRRRRRRRRLGLLDPADARRRPAAGRDRLDARAARGHGVRVISMGFFAEEDQPVIWRGPMLHKALEQFLTDVFWDEPDFLVVDLPPGTGDVSISLAQFLPRAEVYVVTTPQPAAQKVAQRAGFMAARCNLDGQGRHREHELVHRRRRQALRALRRRRRPGAGRPARGAAARPGAAACPRCARAATRASRSSAVDPGSEAGKAFAEIARRIDEELAPTRRGHKELRLI